LKIIVTLNGRISIVPRVNQLLFVIGALSVVMVIVGGLRYVVSDGNSTAVNGAKNTIMYAIVGIIVAFLAYAAVNFLLGSLAGNGVTGTNV
jgi:energy-converting hydrogenase Eha subunit E